MRKAEENWKKKKKGQDRTTDRRTGEVRRRQRRGQELTGLGTREEGGAPQSWGDLLGSQRMALNSASPGPEARLFTRPAAVPKTSWRGKQRGRFWGRDGLRAERPRVEIARVRKEHGAPTAALGTSPDQRPSAGSLQPVLAASIPVELPCLREVGRCLEVEGSGSRVRLSRSRPWFCHVR